MNRLLVLAVLLSFILIPVVTDAGPGCGGSHKSVSAGSGCKAKAATAGEKSSCAAKCGASCTGACKAHAATADAKASCAAKCGASCTGACKASKASAAAADMVMTDADRIASQVELYPLDTCVVAGGKLGSMGEPVNHLHEGRLVRFCCQGCVGAFQENPAAYLEKLDAAVIAAQGESYPLTSCPVAGMKLGSMGEPVDYVHEGRLVRFCCSGCIDKFKEDPASAMAKLDAALSEVSTLN